MNSTSTPTSTATTTATTTAPAATSPTTAVENETALRDVLDRWKTHVDAHEPERVAALFTEEALFQGLHPYSVGRPGVAEYYASQPLGMTADYQILHTRRLADALVLGYLRVSFAFTDRPTLPVYISVLAKRESEGWFLDHYQVSKPD
ncbi:nuclear transport factor 2 family protein [Catenulispora sp. NF23]|uniref:Nuclear transport factor 2 family protein n=1 Tax=Catenulispora pinistramenti TaxID=2705254 RepID=A0ABS5KSD0_9ACTN|nr:nuclear transport factor 2 family protein [Catenulispora pinistramenti]MBS2532701.1 nuclear transport factor 2 family protein [Catenulispora pinistramenti]MBS2548952.1 nuclear transport factor 2 family protein [Catenulispora pinistramenti]